MATMNDREKLIELLENFSTPVELMDVKLMDWTIPTVHIRDSLTDYLIANGVTFAPAVPGPEIADPNIMELCFHNGERHMKEKIISMLDAFDKDYTLEDPFIEYDKLRKALMDL